MGAKEDARRTDGFLHLLGVMPPRARELLAGIGDRFLQLDLEDVTVFMHGVSVFIGLSRLHRDQLVADWAGVAGHILKDALGGCVRIVAGWGGRLIGPSGERQ